MRKSNTKNSKQKTIVENKKDIENIAIELAKQGLTAEKIGLILKEKYGVPKAKITFNKISRVLKENNLYTNPDEANLRKKVNVLKKHLEKNKHDYRTKRALLIYGARLNKLLKLV